MRLLHTKDLDLHNFFGSNIPHYVILSHRWEDEEVTFQDLQAGNGPKMTGWSKIIGCCKQAVDDGLEYAVSISYVSYQFLLRSSDLIIVDRFMLHR